MHDLAQAYYNQATEKMDAHRNAVQSLNDGLVADLLALKVAFDAQWVRRIRDFRGEPEVEERPKEEVKKISSSEEPQSEPLPPAKGLDLESSSMDRLKDFMESSSK